VTEPEERESIGKVKAIVSEIEKEKQQKKKDNEDDEAKKIKKEKTATVLKSRLGLFSLLSALGVLIGGYFVATSADVIAQQTGIGSSFMGFFFVGLTTSLPELSTTISAVKLKRYRMAFSNIFGTNILNVGLVLLADLLHTDKVNFTVKDNRRVAKKGCVTCHKKSLFAGLLCISFLKVLSGSVITAYLAAVLKKKSYLLPEIKPEK
jgi:Ca2+/Na+ antiporter